MHAPGSVRSIPPSPGCFCFLPFPGRSFSLPPPPPPRACLCRWGCSKVLKHKSAEASKEKQAFAAAAMRCDALRAAWHYVALRMDRMAPAALRPAARHSSSWEVAQDRGPRRSEAGR
jgi:hypothetical protein